MSLGLQDSWQRMIFRPVLTTSPESVLVSRSVANHTNSWSYLFRKLHISFQKSSSTYNLKIFGSQARRQKRGSYLFQLPVRALHLYRCPMGWYSAHLLCSTLLIPSNLRMLLLSFRLAPSTQSNWPHIRIPERHSKLAVASRLSKLSILASSLLSMGSDSPLRLISGFPVFLSMTVCVCF